MTVYGPSGPRLGDPTARYSGGIGHMFLRREEWLELVLNGTLKPKPPAWWVRSQNDQGRTGSAPYAIWARSYKPERKYVIWDQAPDEDWREHGYLR